MARAGKARPSADDLLLCRLQPDPVDQVSHPQGTWHRLQRLYHRNFGSASCWESGAGYRQLVLDAPLRRRTVDPTYLVKTAIYWLCVLAVRLAEELVYYLAAGGSLDGFTTFLVARFSWPRFLSIQIWLMVLFLVYVTIHELNTLFGDGELYRLFFRWRSSEAKLSRRRRIRLLFELNRLTEANSIGPSASAARRHTPNWWPYFMSSRRPRSWVRRRARANSAG